MGQMNKLSRCNTKVTTTDGVTEIKLYQTVVVRFPQDKSWVELNSGGWKTVTTKARMTQAARQYDLPYHVVQIKGAWYVWIGKEKHKFEDGKRYTL